MRKLLYLTMILILAGAFTFCCNEQPGESKQAETKAGSESGASVRDNGEVSESAVAKTNAQEAAKAEPILADEKAQITFVELGSVNCIPCKKMQPVMKSIETKYAGQVKVVFHDVWTDEGKPFARQYGIRLIPTQIFVDAAGKEIMRHEGFFPEGEIDAFLQLHGLKAQ
ncbi:MAG: thioredoxin family protein [Calditrichia bacterium]